MNKAALFIQDQGSDMPQLLGPLAVSLMTFICTFAAAGFGMVLRKKLPDDHLREDSKDVIKLVMGLIATMAALVLGLLIASANSSYETQSGELKQVSATIVELDGILAQYGPEQTNRAIGFVWPFQRRLTKSGRRTASGWDS
jgi:amino acid transporter